MVTDKTVLIKHAKNIAQQPLYLTIGNLSYEIQRLRVGPGRMMVGLILIHKGDLFNVKIETYHQIIEVITREKCNKRYISAL